MMSREQLERLKTFIGRLSDEGLVQTFRVVLAEMANRGNWLRRPPQTPPEGGLKDCDPNREP